MKKYIMSFLAALFTLTGCYGLDRAPDDQLSSSTFWQTEDQCKQGLMGVYASLKNTDLYGKMFMIDVNSDVAAGYDQYEALQLGTCTPRTGTANGKTDTTPFSVPTWLSAASERLLLTKCLKTRCWVKPVFSVH